MTRFPSLLVAVRGAVAGAMLLVLVSAAAPVAPFRDTFPDTWVAVDGLGRSLPAYADTGAPRAGKQVGIFYFLWLGQHGDAGPFDISKILAADPAAIQNPQSPLWGPLYAPHHWGESIFGYYIADDEAVLARHAQMLSDAEIDAVIFDVTNQLTYPRSWQALCRVWDRIRKRGGRTPRIVFLCPFWQPQKVVIELYQQLYEPGLYRDLWYHWDGKPLILADPALIGETFSVTAHDSPVELAAGHTLGQGFVAMQPFDRVAGCFPTWNAKNSAMRLTLYRSGPAGERLLSREFTNVPDNGWLSISFASPLPAGSYYLEMSEPRGKVGWWTASRKGSRSGEAFADRRPVAGERNIRVHYMSEVMSRIGDFFTFRSPQPDYFIGPTAPNQWGWLEVSPQHGFTNAAGALEEVSVGVAQNAVDGRLSVLSHPRSHGRSFHNGRQPRPDGQDYQGRNFAEQWRRACELDPMFVFVTGWNEWIAGRFDSKASFYQPGPVAFVDQFNREYSRDCEPMVGGHGDAFYYQLVAGVRKFKGTRPLQPVQARPIRIDGRFDDWSAVEPEFRDDVGDAVDRDHPGWGTSLRYVNRTARHDIVAAKMSFDERSLCFYARTAAPLATNGTHWMLLYLDTDGNHTNGWLGYDFIVNHMPGPLGKALLQPYRGPGYQWGAPVPIECRLGSDAIELAISRTSLGLTPSSRSIDFKWADNIQETGDWSDFTLNGDAAPNARFNYRAILNH